MNILFSAFINPHAQSGVEKKIFGQIKALEALGSEVWYFTFENGFITLKHGEEDCPLFAVKDDMISYYLALENAARQVVAQQNIDIFYIRRIFCTPFHLKTLRLAKKRGIRLVEELPTYPYDAESKSYKALSYKITAVVDRLTRSYYKKYLDYFVTYSKDTHIFGVPCINLENGIDFDNIRFVPTIFPEKEINLLAVSAMSPWHGYERVIEGLKNYYSDQHRQFVINLHLVGEGQEKANWQALTKTYSLQEHVIFHGHKTGEALSGIFDLCQIGVASLGFYKIGLFDGSPLKTREYIAMGKPFIYSNGEERLKDKQDFCKKVSNDSSPLDMNDVITFYQSVKAIDKLCDKMNNFAQQNYSWQAQMQKMVDILQGN